MFQIMLILSLIGNVQKDKMPPVVQVGTASVYSTRFDGQQTSSGEIHRSHLLSAAHKTLPTGTRVKVTHLKNGCSIELVVNDRLPKQSPHIIDLSPKAASQIEIPPHGIGRVRLEVIYP